MCLRRWQTVEHCSCSATELIEYSTRMHPLGFSVVLQLRCPHHLHLGKVCLLKSEGQCSSLEPCERSVSDALLKLYQEGFSFVLGLLDWCSKRYKAGGTTCWCEATAGGVMSTSRWHCWHRAHANAQQQKWAPPRACGVSMGACSGLALSAMEICCHSVGMPGSSFHCTMNALACNACRKHSF